MCYDFRLVRKDKETERNQKETVMRVILQVLFTGYTRQRDLKCAQIQKYF